MAASTITRTTWTDDTGTVSAPNNDGTLISNAQLQAIYAAIDQLLSGGGSYTTLRLGGLIAAEGFGTSTFEGAGTGGQLVSVRNTSSGTGNYAGIRVGNNSGAGIGFLLALSSAYTTSGANIASAVVLRSSGAGGLAIHADAGEIGFYTDAGAGVRRARFHTNGDFEVYDAAAPDTAGYGIVGVTRPATAGDLSYFAMTKQGTAAFGIGVDASQRVIIGTAGTGRLITPSVRIGSAASLFPSGSAFLPGVSFLSSPATGMFLSGGSALGLSANGVDVCTFFASQGTLGAPFMQVNGNEAYGGGATEGPGVLVGNNTSDQGAGGWLAPQARNGTTYFLWVDATGDLRINTVPPTADNSTVSDLAGTVVGTQS